MKALSLSFFSLVFSWWLSRAEAQELHDADSAIEGVLQSYPDYPTTEESFDALLSCVALENDVQDTERLADFYYHLAVDLWDLGLREQALLYIQKCIDNCQAASLEPYVLFLRKGTKVGYLLEMSRPDSALSQALEAHKITVELDSIYESASLNNIGLCYWKLDSIDRAKSYFDSALQLVPVIWDNPSQQKYMEIAVRDNSAQLHAEENDLHEAIRMVSSNLSGLHSIPNADSYWHSKLVEYELRKARWSIKMGDWSTVKNSSEQLRTYFKQCPEDLSTKDNLAIFKLEHDLALHSNDDKSAKALSDSILFLTEQINHNISENQLSSIERLSSISLNKTRKEYQRTIELGEQRVRFRNYLLLLLGLLSLLLFGSGYLIYKVRLQQRLMENQELELAISHKNRDINNLALDITRRKQITEEVLEYIGDLKASKSDKKGLDLSMVERDLKKKIKADEKREWLHEQVEQVNSAFYDRLRSAYPDLVTTELELCAMIRSGMSNKEIAEIRNISPGSARTARYRLGKKLGVPEGQNMVELLNQI